MSGALNSDSLIGNDVNRSVRVPEAMFLAAAQIHLMIAPGDRKRLRQFSGTGTEPMQLMNSTPPSH
jgi:hypothetical protein